MTMTGFSNPIAVAIDHSDIGQAEKLVDAVKSHVGCIKLGMEFFFSHGRAGYNRLARFGLPVFLDLKLHDISNTVGRALKALLSLEPSPALVNIHASGGRAMIEAAAEAAAGRSKLIAVTVLTSLTAQDLKEIGFADEENAALALARLAKDSGADGVVCSPLDVARIKAELGQSFLAVVPGLRPVNAPADDQRRIATPRDAWKAGADLLVIGRPITQAADPGKAARQIAEELIDAR
jgi:orotidine-5'-phosphate decarboxylase